MDGAKIGKGARVVKGKGKREAGVLDPGIPEPVRVIRSAGSRAVTAFRPGPLHGVTHLDRHILGREGIAVGAYLHLERSSLEAYHRQE